MVWLRDRTGGGDGTCSLWDSVARSVGPVAWCVGASCAGDWLDAVSVVEAGTGLEWWSCRGHGCVAVPRRVATVRTDRSGETLAMRDAWSLVAERFDASLEVLPDGLPGWSRLGDCFGAVRGLESFGRALGCAVQVAVLPRPAVLATRVTDIASRVIEGPGSGEHASILAQWSSWPSRVSASPNADCAGPGLDFSPLFDPLDAMRRNTVRDAPSLAPPRAAATVHVADLCRVSDGPPGSGRTRQRSPVGVVLAGVSPIAGWAVYFGLLWTSWALLRGLVRGPQPRRDLPEERKIKWHERPDRVAGGELAEDWDDYR